MAEYAETGRRGSNDATKEEQIAQLKKEMAALLKESNAQNETIEALSNRNQHLEESIYAMKQQQTTYLGHIDSLQRKSHHIQEQSVEITRMKEQLNSSELQKLDAKALELELSKERAVNQRLYSQTNKIEQEIYDVETKIDEKGQQLEDAVTTKIQLIQKTNEEIGKLREFISHYQKYYESQQKQ